MDKNKEFSNIVLQEIGLEVTKDNKVVDQDTQTEIKYKGKSIKYSPVDKPLFIGRNDIEFNPISNINLMNHLFGYYANKLEQEEDRHINMTCFSDTGENEKGVAICYETVNGRSNSLKSKEYYNSSVMLTDLISQINGNNSIDYSQYDEKIDPKTRANKTQKRRA